MVAEHPDGLITLIVDVVEDPKPAFRYCGQRNGMKIFERCSLRTLAKAWVSVEMMILLFGKGATGLSLDLILRRLVAALHKLTLSPSLFSDDHQLKRREKRESGP